MENENPKPVKLYNPLLSNFRYPWFDDHDEEHILMLPSLEITTLPYAQGVFMAKHLTDAVCNDRGIKNDSDKWKLVYEEVLINDSL